MGLRDLFKKEKKEKKEEKKETKKEPKKGLVKKEEKKPVKPAKKEETKKTLSKEKKIDPNLFSVLLKPIITEKTSDLMVLNQYAFKVAKKANKEQIKRAVEHLYSVKVEKVRIINQKRKKKNLGRYQGWKPAFKKAIVTLKQGDKIEIMPQ